MPCDPSDPSSSVRFSFELVPAGNWGIRVLLSWVGPEGSEHARYNEFPPYAEPLEWYEVAEGGTTELELVAAAPGGGLRGRLIDAGNGLPVGAQYEPGAPMVSVWAFGRDGRVVGGDGNACDGSFTIWAPAEEVAVAAVGWQDSPETEYWQSEWVVSGAGIDPLDLSYGMTVSIDPELIPDGEWTAVTDGVIRALEVRLMPGEAWPALGGTGWYPWWVPPIVGEPLAGAAPWRDPGFWIGRALGFSHTTDTWPPTLLVDGEDIGLVGEGGPEVGSPNWVIARPAPPDGAQGSGGEPAFFPAYALLLAIDADLHVTDALVVDVGPTQYVSLYGVAPYAPNIDYAIEGHRTRVCSVEGPADRAWEIIEGKILEVDPAGISVIPAG